MFSSLSLRSDCFVPALYRAELSLPFTVFPLFFRRQSSLTSSGRTLFLARVPSFRWFHSSIFLDLLRRTGLPFLPPERCGWTNPFPFSCFARLVFLHLRSRRSMRPSLLLSLQKVSFFPDCEAIGSFLQSFVSRSCPLLMHGLPPFFP